MQPYQCHNNIACPAIQILKTICNVSAYNPDEFNKMRKGMSSLPDYMKQYRGSYDSVDHIYHVSIMNNQLLVATSMAYTPPKDPTWHPGMHFYPSTYDAIKHERCVVTDYRNIS